MIRTIIPNPHVSYGHDIDEGKWLLVTVLIDGAEDKVEKPQIEFVSKGNPCLSIREFNELVRRVNGLVAESDDAERDCDLSRIAHSQHLGSSGCGPPQAS